MTGSPSDSAGKPPLEKKSEDAVPAETETTTDVAEPTVTAHGPDDAVDSTATRDMESAPETDVTDEAEATDETEATEATDATDAKRQVNWTRVLAYVVLPGLALVLALTAGFLKWTESSIRAADAAAIESVQVAKDSTIELLTYQPETVEQDLSAARDLLTGEFEESYTTLINDVVIPGAKQEQIAAAATVPGAASVSADPNHAVVLVFVNQTATVGNTAPTDTASTVRVTLDKVDDRWLISGFDPI